MRKQLYFVLGLGLLVSADAAFAQSAAAGIAAGKEVVDIIRSLTGGGPCTRHLYNKSNSFWLFTGSGGSGMCEKGCAIAPNTAIPISYSTTSMSIDLQGPGYHDGFTVTGRGDCVYIQHNGNTGKAVLNDPANGDIVLIN